MERVTITDQQAEAEPTVEEPTTAEATEETSPQEEGNATNRPDWLPNKFESAQDLAKAYGQLEKKFSSRQAEEQGLLTADDFQQYSDQYQENGGLDDKTYEDLGKKGLSRELVDQYITGQQLLANQQVQELQNVAGGEENYKNMIQWASETLQQDDLDAFNDAVQGSPAVAKLAIRGLYAQFNKEVGASASSPSLIQGGKAGNLGGYGSTYEMQQDMKNPLYKAGDQKFHEMVDRRLAATSGSVI